MYAGFNASDQATAGETTLPVLFVMSPPPPPPLVGRLCELEETPSALASRTSCQNLDDYLSKLAEGSGCSQGQPGTLSWTPDQDTPDIVYYQVCQGNDWTQC